MNTIPKPYLHVHLCDLPAQEIATVFQGCRIDYELGRPFQLIVDLTAHYQAAGLKILYLVHDMTQAIQVLTRWPGADVQFLCEPDLIGMDWCPHIQYAVLAKSLKSRGFQISGPGTNRIARDWGYDAFRSEGGIGALKKFIVHGYPFEPEELPTLVAWCRRLTTKEILIGEWTNANSEMWDDKERAEYHARGIKACPVPLVIYRGPHIIPEDDKPGFPGYWENNDGKKNYMMPWRPRPAWSMLKASLGLTAVD